MLRRICVLALFWLFAGSVVEPGFAADKPASPKPAAEKPASNRIKILWLGDTGHHQPRNRVNDIIGALAKAGIDTSYTEDPADLRSELLDRYDALVIYANQTEISPEQEQALISYVESGHGFVPLHCASFCFLNSPRYIALVGGQFKEHGGEVFRPTVTQPDHPAMQGLEYYETWDETYVHHKLSDDRDVLMERVTADHREPWTWTRLQGRGRVFYTASGHDERTFRNRQFQQLVINGIRWSVGRSDAKFSLPETPKIAADLPNYVKGAKWGTVGDAIKQIQGPLAPAVSQQHLSLPGGFSATLFASEPEIVKPIAITWDSRGRTWIAETTDYPNDMQQPGKGRDRIRILQDTNGDGAADKSTVFADKLSIPTSIVWTPQGLIVAQAPDMLLLVDTNGDDVCDERRTLLTGFGTQDTHAGPSNLRLGFDGWVYATCGYSGFSGDVSGQKVSFGQGLFRFRPDGTAMEFLAASSNNTWGLGLGETGEVFYSTANGEHSSYLAIPNRRFEAMRGILGRGTVRMADHSDMHPLTEIRQVDHFGGFTAAAGHAVYTARHFPAEFWNRIAFVCEPTGHVVHQVQLHSNGSSYVSSDRMNLLASTDEWTGPIAAEVGPDGALWVLDWYNAIIQHNPTPLGFETGRGNAYVTPLRDKTHGRIYRVTFNNRPLTTAPDLTSGKPAAAVAALRSDNQFWRMQGQWQLVSQRDKVADETLKSLAAIVSGESKTGESNPGDGKPAAATKSRPRASAAATLGAPPATQPATTSDDPTVATAAAVHALWTLHLLSPESPITVTALQAAIVDTRAEVRKTAANIAAELVTAERLTAEVDPLVLRQMLLAAAAQKPQAGLGNAIWQLQSQRGEDKDRWIPQAAMLAAASNDSEYLLAAVSAATSNAVQANCVRAVAEHFARGNPADQSLSQLLEHLAKLSDGNTAVAESLLTGLAAGWQPNAKNEPTPAARAAVVAVLPKLSSDGQSAAVAISERLGFANDLAAALVDLRNKLLAEILDDQRTDDARLASARTFSQLKPTRTELEQLLPLMSAKASPEFSSGLLAAAADGSSSDFSSALLAYWSQLLPGLRSKAISALMQRPERTMALLDAIDSGVVTVSELRADQAQLLAVHPDAAVAARAKALLARGGQLPDPDREAVLKALLPLTEKKGEVALGREVFTKNCAKCHKHGDIGEKIGPALTGFSVHPKSKILTEIIDPNRSVEGNFRQYTVVLKSGKVLAGLLANETRTALELVDTEAKRHTILRDDIDELVASSKSVMPEGLEKQLSETDLTNLLEFLTARGKYFPLPLAKVATITTVRGMFYDSASSVETLVATNWQPVLVGEVPFELVDPQDGRTSNIVMLNGPLGKFPPSMPHSVELPVNAAARAIHLLSGVSGWGYPVGSTGSLSMTVRLHYHDGSQEDHPLLNGEHFADYIRRVDVPKSQFAFSLRDQQQMRYLTIEPKRGDLIDRVEFIKGTDDSAPLIMAVTVEQK